VKGVAKADIEEAAKWVGGLDRIHRARGILTCYDFSATPFAPSGKRSSEEALFDWIVSDFGLNDAIESGLVKTPRVVVRDDALPDAKTYKSRLYHIYNDPEVKRQIPVERCTSNWFRGKKRTRQKALLATSQDSMCRASRRPSRMASSQSGSGYAHMPSARRPIRTGAATMAP
jgi:hypothetical protein